MQEQTSYFGKEKISKILLKLAPPRYGGAAYTGAL